MDFDLPYYRRRWSRTPPAICIEEAARLFTPIAASHCQRDSECFLHMVARIRPMKVVYIWEPESAGFAEELAKRYDIRTYLMQEGEDKLATLRRAAQTEGANAILHGIRDDQTAHRSTKAVVELGTDGIYRVHPILYWKQGDVDAYMRRHGLAFLTVAEDGPRTECGIHCFQVADDD